MRRSLFVFVCAQLGIAVLAFGVSPVPRSEATPKLCVECLCKRIEAWAPPEATVATGRAKYNSTLETFVPVINARSGDFPTCENGNIQSAGEDVTVCEYFQISPACINGTTELEYTHPDNPSVGSQVVDRTKCYGNQP